MPEIKLYLGVRVHKKPILFLSLLIVFPLVTSQALGDIDLSLVTDDFYLAPGRYTLEIKTNEDGFYGATALGRYRGWVVFDNPFITTRKGAGEINFSINPPENTKAGTYGFPIMVYMIENDSFYSIKDYNLIIEDKTEADITEFGINKDSFSPGEKIEVTGKVVNTGTSDLDELKLYVKFQGDGYEVVREEEFSLNVAEGRTFKETFDTSIHPDPGKYSVDVTLLKFSQKMDSRKRVVEIKEIGKIEKTYDKSWMVLQESGSFYLNNVGNIEKTEQVEMVISKPWDWFTFFSEMPEINDMGVKVLYVWEVTLKPEETKTIKYDIHYWPFAIVALVIIYGLYMALRQIKRPSVRKHSIQTKILDDDKREVMVALEVKSGGKQMKDVVVEDCIPPVVQLIKDFKTVKPKIKREDDNIKLKWEFKNLDKNENIILSYRFRTLIGTVGYLKLPKAVLKAKIKNVKNEYFSNSLKIKEE